MRQIYPESMDGQIGWIGSSAQVTADSYEGFLGVTVSRWKIRRMLRADEKARAQHVADELIIDGIIADIMQDVELVPIAVPVEPLIELEVVPAGELVNA